MLLPLTALKAVPLATGTSWSEPPAANPIFDPLYPESAKMMMRSFDAGTQEVLYRGGVFGGKEAQLMALAASAGMKCEYCILAHTAMARAAGATDDEIAAAVMMAAEIQFRSTILYGNEYSQEKLRKMVTGG